MDKKSKEKLIRTLRRLYPKAVSALNFKGEYQLAIAVILSAQCTDKKVNEVTPLLFKEYPSFKALANGSVRRVEQLIRPINYYKTKAKNIISLAKIVEKKYNGKLPKDYNNLIKLPGIGNKTANVILSELGIAYTFPVDTHIFRVAKRLGLSKGKTREEVESDLKREFHFLSWRNLHHRLIYFGREICKARSPRCAECKLKDICDYYKKLIKNTI